MRKIKINRGLPLLFVDAVKAALERLAAQL
jgi:hypothetical protein